MIVSLFLVAIGSLINFVFGLLPNIPSVPESLSSAINNFFDLIFNNSGLVGFFLPMDIVKIALPIAIIIVNFEYIYRFCIWIIKKIPISIE